MDGSILYVFFSVFLFRQKSLLFLFECLIDDRFVLVGINATIPLRLFAQAVVYPLL